MKELRPGENAKNNIPSWRKPGVLLSSATNSTKFTECCEVAICDDQARCPHCRQEVIGADARTDHERERIRWSNATAHWEPRFYEGWTAEDLAR